MSKMVIQSKDAKLFEEATEWENGIYSIRFVGYEDTIWCKSKSDIYLALEQFKKTGKVNTDENGELISI